MASRTLMVIVLSVLVPALAEADCDEAWAQCMHTAQEVHATCQATEAEQCRTTCSSQCSGSKDPKCQGDCIKICRGTNRCRTAFEAAARDCQSERAACLVRNSNPRRGGTAEPVR
jgi:hypothetical protein